MIDAVGLVFLSSLKFCEGVVFIFWVVRFACDCGLLIILGLLGFLCWFGIIFIYRNIDRIYKENQKYKYNVFLSPYYEITDVHFRVDKGVDNLINNYLDCIENNINCDSSKNYQVREIFGKYVFTRRKWLTNW